MNGHEEANARLAAAPDLLAACNLAHTALDSLLAQLIAMDSTFYPSESTAWPAVVALNAAIAKAEGREVTTSAPPASAIAQYLHDAHINAEMAEYLELDGWSAVAREVGVPTPDAAVKAEVIEILKRREDAETIEDIIDGHLPGVPDVAGEFPALTAAQSEELDGDEEEYLDGREDAI